MSTQRIDIMGVPLDHNSSYMRGPAKGPFHIIEALYCESANLWTESGQNLEPLLHHGGVMELGDPDTSFERIEQEAFKAGNGPGTPLFLGGDHSITYPLVRGLKKAVGDFAILHLDAHPDCYDIFEGNRLSHACPFARIMEEGLCSRLVSVGIRTATGSQREVRDRFGMEWLEMKERAGWPKINFSGPVYVSVDLDVLDPAFAPGLSHHEPGGLSTREVLDIIQAVDGPIIGADIVELNPDRDRDSVTAMAAAKILRELASMMLKG